MDSQGEKAARLLVQRFEGGHYDTTTVLPDGAGISYGLYQGTAKSGTLIEIIEEYLRLGGEGLDGTDVTNAIRSIGMTKPCAMNDPDVSRTFHRLVHVGFSDPIMRDAQDVVFGNLYWVPAKALGVRLGLHLPLSYAAIFDTAIQSGIRRVWRHRQTFSAVPPSRGGNEKVWTRAYVFARHKWLGGYTSSSPEKQALVRRTVYRPKKLIELIRQGDWNLESVK